MPTRLPTPPAIYSCKHGEQQLGEFVRPICDKCRKPLRHPTFERPRCDTPGCKRNNLSTKDHKWPQPTCPKCGRRV